MWNIKLLHKTFWSQILYFFLNCSFLFFSAFTFCDTPTFTTNLYTQRLPTCPPGTHDMIDVSDTNSSSSSTGLSSSDTGMIVGIVIGIIVLITIIVVFVCYRKKSKLSSFLENVVEKHLVKAINPQKKKILHLFFWVQQITIILMILWIFAIAIIVETVFNFMSKWSKFNSNCLRLFS